MSGAEGGGVGALFGASRFNVEFEREDAGYETVQRKGLVKEVQGEGVVGR